MGRWAGYGVAGCRTEGWESSLTTYHIGIEDADGEAYADAHGSLGVISYVSKEVAKEVEADSSLITVKLTETDGIRGEAKRTVLAITADGETAAVMLKRRITAERKAGKTAEPAPESVSA